MVEYFIARQPIYSSRMDLFAYELLCRASRGNSYVPKDDMEATCQVILHTFTDLGIDKISARRPVFIKMPRQFLLAGYHVSCPRQQAYLELMAGEVLDEELCALIMRLSGDGYRIVLHGLPEDRRAWGLLERVSYIKLDVRRLGPEGLAQQVEQARAFLPKLCAEKVETQSEFQRCCELGLPYVQGFFFCRPRVQGAKQVAANRAALLQVIADVNDPKTNTDKLARSISMDAALAYKLLRTLNSAFYSLPTRIESVRQALVLLGCERVRVWATMILLSRLVEKPHELITTSLLRANMCEQLAPAMRLVARADSLFMVGLFSVLDAMTDAPMSVVLQKLPLASDVYGALLQQGGPLGAVLSAVIAYERGEFDKLKELPLSPEQLRKIYMSSVSWAEDTTRQLTAPASV